MEKKDQQPQYYRTVKASEKPQKQESYICYVMNNKKQTGRITTAFFSGKNWMGIPGNSQLEYWLEPIPMPDAERLRVALEKITYIANDLVGICRKYANDDPYEDSIVDEAWRRILDARLALSAVGDGWVRVEDGLPDNGEKVLCLTNDIFKRMVENSWEAHTDQDQKWFRKSFSHWRPLPSQPINK